jgi:hypothetical protein
MAEIQGAGLPLKVFEAWRSPDRQRFLFEQGRTRPGPKVTFARAWESYHQYGLAVDIVGFVDGKWTWDLPDATWQRMHAIGAAHGLERLGFETPHLQLADLRIGALMEGELPGARAGKLTWRRRSPDGTASHPRHRFKGTTRSGPLLMITLLGGIGPRRRRQVLPIGMRCSAAGRGGRYDGRGTIFGRRLRCHVARQALPRPARRFWTSTVQRSTRRRSTMACRRS